MVGNVPHLVRRAVSELRRGGDAEDAGAAGQAGLQLPAGLELHRQLRLPPRLARQRCRGLHRVLADLGRGWYNAAAVPSHLVQTSLAAGAGRDLAGLLPGKVTRQSAVVAGRQMIYS